MLHGNKAAKTNQHFVDNDADVGNAAKANRMHSPSAKASSKVPSSGSIILEVKEIAVIKIKPLGKVASRAIIFSAWAKEKTRHSIQRLTSSEQWVARLGEPVWEQNKESIQKPRNICIFVIYAENSSLSTLSYLHALKESDFHILAINNMTSSREFLAELRSICWRVYNRHNIGRDIGAYKDGIILLHSEGTLERCNFLCLANDSMHFIPGRYGASFTGQIKDFVNSGSGALFTHESRQFSPHFQSYFQLLDKSIFQSQRFISFWIDYEPLSHREHCIFEGEIKLSTSIYNHLPKVKTLYSTCRLLEVLANKYTENKVAISEILGLMPSPSLTIRRRSSSFNTRTKKAEGFNLINSLVKEATKGGTIQPHHYHQISELIELSNPSHLAAFLYPRFLECPLVKHDICLGGSFSIGMAARLFKNALKEAEVPLDEHDERADEFLSCLNKKGVPSDYRSRLIQQSLRGIGSGFTYPDI